MATHLTYTQRVRGELSIIDEKPRDMWDQHSQILEPIASGDGAHTEAWVREHITLTAGFMVVCLRAHRPEESVEG